MKNILNKILNKKEKASYSIETAIVMTITFIVIMFLIFMTYIMYEQVRLSSLAQEAAERGAMIYAMKNKEMYTGRIQGDSFSQQNPYWRIMDFNGEERLGRVKTYIKDKLNARKLSNEKYDINGTTSKGKKIVDVQLKNYFIYKRMVVDINVEYKVPFGGILSIFIKNPYPIHAHAEATVSEPAEFIRTIDLGADIIENFAGGAVDKYKGAIQKALNWINKH